MTHTPLDRNHTPLDRYRGLRHHTEWFAAFIHERREVIAQIGPIQCKGHRGLHEALYRATIKTLTFKTISGHTDRRDVRIDCVFQL